MLEQVLAVLRDAHALPADRRALVVDAMRAVLQDHRRLLAEQIGAVDRALAELPAHCAVGASPAAPLVERVMRLLPNEQHPPSSTHQNNHHEYNRLENNQNKAHLQESSTVAYLQKYNLLPPSDKHPPTHPQSTEEQQRIFASPERLL